LHALLATAGTETVRVPFAWTGVRLWAAAATRLRVRLHPAQAGGWAITATDPAGRPVLTADAVVVREATAAVAPQPMYELRWTPLPRPEPAPLDGREVVAVASGGDVHERLAEILALLRGSERLVLVTSGALAERPDPVTAAIWGLV